MQHRTLTVKGTAEVSASPAPSYDIEPDDVDVSYSVLAGAWRLVPGGLAEWSRHR